MCFSPKIKTPKVDTQAIRAPEPAPLTEEVKGVEFGGMTGTEDNESTSSEVKSSGKSSLKVSLDKPKSGGVKKSISARAFGKK